MLDIHKIIDVCKKKVKIKDLTCDATGIVFDGGCEWFVFERISEGRDEDGMVFSFCKTQRLPYNLYVGACLLVFKHHFRSIKLCPDGRMQDLQPAIDLCKELLGYTEERELRDADDKSDTYLEPKEGAVSDPNTPNFCDGADGGCGKLQPQRQRFSFTAVIVGGGEWIIGRADEGVKGFTPLTMPSEGSLSEEKAHERAAELNKSVGWASEKEAQILVLKTMGVKEDHLTKLLEDAVNLLDRVRREDAHVEMDEIKTFIDEDCKGYVKDQG